MDPAKKKKLFTSLVKFISQYTVEILKDMVIKKALKALLGTAAGVGFQAWIVKYVVTEFFEEIAQPIARAAVIEVGYRYDIHEGKVFIKRLKEAGNVEDYNSTVDDILS